MSDVTVHEAIDSVHPLDNVTWNALTSKHRAFAEGDGRVLRYPAAVAPFTAITDTLPSTFDALHALVQRHGVSALTTREALAVPGQFTVVRHAKLAQMVWQGEAVTGAATDYVRLGERDVRDMMSLTTATQPGPFGVRTFELGNYYGIRSHGRLIAMAGERMRLDGFTEISAVCVDPEFRGKGLANGLMKLLIATIRERGEVPFLHVLTSNQGAIALYRTLGFVERAELHLTVIGDATR
ncbi:GNAT family N-acetyltransferase [Paraburkholderia acidisoli]|uniref:GNAT family N-acetyltransferase n=1 Tax=Paraburkholderia acidisoli TaxID=2571748 RepID=A0A7Z2GQ02_9BURK|nr:GNAT family N-acetyltransferase [Paraburkholderia acidisoli]QGZ65434.1 GNAT family N-acetyltransferase [Paraburkholderia acidisoli]